MNEYVVSLRTADDSLILPIVKPICCYSKLHSILFTSKDVDDAIRKLKNKKERKSIYIAPFIYYAYFKALRHGSYSFTCKYTMPAFPS